MKYSNGSNKMFENSSQSFSNSEGKMKEFDVLLLLLLLFDFCFFVVNLLYEI